MLTGAVSTSRDGARVSLSLYDGAAGNRAWTHSYLYDSVGAGQIVRVAASEIAARIAGSVTPQETQLLERLPTQNRLAYEWSLKGDAAADGLAYDRAADAFRRAIQLDRGYNDAYSKLALADANLLDDGVEKSEGGAVLLEELQSAASRAVANSSNIGDRLARRGESARSRRSRNDGVAHGIRPRCRARRPQSNDPRALWSGPRANRRPRGGDRHVASRPARWFRGAPRVLTTLAEIAIADRKDGEACGSVERRHRGRPAVRSCRADRALLRMKHGELRFAWADAAQPRRLVARVDWARPLPRL